MNNLRFRAKTNDGFIIKILAELLQNNVRIACLYINSCGINVRTMDSNRHILIDITLKSNHFNIFETEEEITVGINLIHFYRLVKSIKKRDMIMLSINKSAPNDLIITVFPKDNNSIVESMIRIQPIQQIIPKLPSGYSSPIIVPSPDYQRTIKDMDNIGEAVTIAMKRHSLSISCSTQGIYTRTVKFGELSDDQSDETYRETFNMEFFTRILKITGLNPYLHFFSGAEDRPLLIETMVGHLGTISIFIKSQSQVEADKSSMLK
jgi:proliferating cell nuclear antigen